MYGPDKFRVVFNFPDAIWNTGQDFGKSEHGPPDDNTAYVHYYYRWNSNHFYYLLQTVKSAGNGIGNGAKGSSQGE